MFFIVSAFFIAMAFVLGDRFSDVVLFLMLPVVMSGVLGVFLLSFDEKFKWTKYSAALPYSPAQIVLSKYIIGFIYQIFTAVIVFLALVVWVKTGGNIIFAEAVDALGRVFAVSLMIPTIGLPFCFRFGTEKGRIFYMVFVFVSALAFSHFVAGHDVSIKRNDLILLIIAAAVALCAVSMAISIAIYKRREITG